ncbi:hypothetical protein NP233_g8100 [Leucocoprinus birnbaumii]|uniref:Uncharacterized protein n=1 Tax=Leucocoprinus birnbaumii TaxID=56174 RepID=A0AAD5VQM9_9AGAR|nr:hypothetical protein NP233_g8100 [Leucocoprinus birnbaumii]
MHLDDISARLAHYGNLAEAHMNLIRNRPGAEDVYNIEASAWNARRIVIPAKDDEEELQAFFKMIDPICEMQPTTTEECLRATFACYAAAQALSNQLLGMGEVVAGRVLARGLQLMDSQGEPASHLGNGEGSPHPHPDLISQSVAVAFGQTFSYRDVTGEIKQCTLLDHGFSDLRGEFYLIIEEQGPGWTDGETRLKRLIRRDEEDEDKKDDNSNDMEDEEGFGDDTDSEDEAGNHPTRSQRLGCLSSQNEA